MGYQQRAASLADLIRSELGLSVILSEGSKGAFEVALGNRVIYSKIATRRIPKPQDLITLLNDLSSIDHYSSNNASKKSDHIV